jgi:cyclopropane fatty-acyl-phospholipid synthase-like methyltransferase
MYQSVYNTSGIRNTEDRVKTYGFKDFTGQKVLDIGCSNGMFCRTACDLGAVRVVGLEYPNMAQLAQLLAFVDGYFNIDFYGVDLRRFNQKQLIETTGIERFNTHFFFAMENHVGWPEYTKNCDTLYYEGHGQPRPFKIYHFK